MAAAVRICLTDAPDFRVRLRELNTWVASTENVYRKALWNIWYESESSFYRHLTNPYDHLVSHLSLNPAKIHNMLSLNHHRHPNSQVRVGLNLESTIYKQILPLDLPLSQRPEARAR